MGKVKYSELTVGDLEKMGIDLKDLLKTTKKGKKKRMRRIVRRDDRKVRYERTSFFGKNRIGGGGGGGPSFPTSTTTVVNPGPTEKPKNEDDEKRKEEAAKKREEERDKRLEDKHSAMMDDVISENRISLRSLEAGANTVFNAFGETAQKLSSNSQSFNRPKTRARTYDFDSANHYSSDEVTTSRKPATFEKEDKKKKNESNLAVIKISSIFPPDPEKNKGFSLTDNKGINTKNSIPSDEFINTEVSAVLNDVVDYVVNDDQLQNEPGAYDENVDNPNDALVVEAANNDKQLTNERGAYDTSVDNDVFNTNDNELAVIKEIKQNLANKLSQGKAPPQDDEIIPETKESKKKSSKRMSQQKAPPRDDEVTIGIDEIKQNTANKMSQIENTAEEERKTTKRRRGAPKKLLDEYLNAYSDALRENNTYLIGQAKNGLNYYIKNNGDEADDVKAQMKKIKEEIETAREKAAEKETMKRLKEAEAQQTKKKRGNR